MRKRSCNVFTIGSGPYQAPASDFITGTAIPVDGGYEAHLIQDGVDVDALKRRNQETKGPKYERLWYQAKISEYELIAANEMREARPPGLTQ